jgi:integrase
MKIGLANFNKVFGDMPVRHIKVTDLEIYQVQRIQQGHAASYIDQDIGFVASMINKGFLVNKVGPQPLKAFKALKRLQRTGANARTRTLSIAEYVGLVKHAKPHLRPVIQAMMATGMRPGEVLNLRWDRIDLKDRFIRLRAEDTKSGQARSIPVSDALMDVLRALPRNLHDNHVFLYEGRSMGRVERSFKAACGAVGIVYGRSDPNGVILHDIRRTVKTNMLEAGLDKSYRDLILGHVLQGMDRHYVKPKENRLATAMARYSTWLEDKIRSVDQTVDQAANLES